MFFFANKKLVHQSFLKFLSSYSHTVLKKHVNILLASNQKQTCELELLLKSGDRRQVTIECTLIENALIHFVITDITKIKQLEFNNFKLNKSLEFMNSLFQNINEAVAYLDEELYFTEFNPLFLREMTVIFATKIAVGMNFFTVLADFDEHKLSLMDGCKKALSGKNVTIIIENSGNCENNYSYEIKLKPLYDEGIKQKGLLLAIRNITKYKMQEHVHSIKQANIEHTARRNTMGEMASALAHEISQPLMVITAYSQSCLLKVKDHPVNDLQFPLEQMAIQAEHAGKILHKMKKFMREGELHREAADINILVEEAFSFLRYELIEFKLKINLNLGKCLPKVIIDKIQITQVVLNLIRNSIEAMQNNNQNDAELTIYTSIQNENIIVSVQDNGPGIPVLYMDKILKSYFTTKTQGTGLGLSICKTLIDAHKGKLWFHQKEPSGVKFNFSLPINQEITHAKV